MMKKVISLFLVMIMSLSCLSVTAYATEDSNSDIVSEENNNVRLNYIITSESLLAINRTQAKCTSKLEAISSVTKITAVQTLEKHWAFVIFNAVDGASWTKTVYTSNLSMTNTKSGLSSGTYRLKTDFTVTTANGQSETVTVYSGEKTIN